MFFPGVIAAAADGAVALGRIGKFLTAEELAEPYAIRKESDFAIDVNGDFEWETVQKPGSQPTLGRRREKIGSVENSSGR